ncbi:MAG: DUF2834 domain-containing protein [Alphaproteobacteria bacterium]
MSDKLFITLLSILGIGFAIAFSVIVVPPLVASGDIIAAFGAGFVNPYASGYSLDTLMCWAVLAVWVIYEARSLNIKHGWIALLIGVAPGVATGFALYLILRWRQLAAKEG